MGNQHSYNNSDNNRNNPFGRVVGGGGGGALGLSRAELDKRCQPSGLYDSCHWDERAIRKLVGDGKAAARLKGSDYRTSAADQECPICFLYYEEINVTKCCHATICTECFLQVRPQKDKLSVCPFCNSNKLSISVANKPSEQEILNREREEQRAKEARTRERNGSLGNSEDLDSAGTYPIKIPDGNGTSDTTTSVDASSTCSFGTSLERDSRVAMMRKRSESIASSETSGHEGNSSFNETSMIEAMAMTPDERRRLEAEMRNQNLHPLTLQIEAEAERRRSQHEQSYYRSHTTDRRAYNSSYGRSSRRRNRGNAELIGGGGGAAPPRNWNEIVAAFERGGNGAVNSLDDLVVLEAAILLSMDEDARRGRGAGGSGSGGGGSGNGNGSDDSDDNDGGEEFDVAQHARDGFPLVRSFLANRGREEREPATRQQVQNLARSLNTSRRRNQSLRSRIGSQSLRAMPDSAIDTATLLMQGISEEEQLAMAIEASLRDQISSTSNNEETTEEVNGPPDEAGEEITGTNDDTSAGESATEPEEEDDQRASPRPALASALADAHAGDDVGDAVAVVECEDAEVGSTGDGISGNIGLLVASAAVASGNAPDPRSEGTQIPNEIGDTADAADGTDGADGSGDGGGGE